MSALRSVKEMQGYAIRAADDDIGSVAEFYFDDERWTVRYLVVDTGDWLPGRQVLISPVAIESVDAETRTLSLRITKAQVEGSPGIDADKPISHQYERSYYDYYGWPYYWSGGGVWEAWSSPALLAMPDATTRSSARAGEEAARADPHLRSTREVIDYHIHATDDEIGHVEDFLVDDESWEVHTLIVDTSNSWFGKKVGIAPSQMRHVSWEAREVFVDLTKGEIKNAPEWDTIARSIGR